MKKLNNILDQGEFSLHTTIKNKRTILYKESCNNKVKKENLT